MFETKKKELDARDVRIKTMLKEMFIERDKLNKRERELQRREDELKRHLPDAVPIANLESQIRKLKQELQKERNEHSKIKIKFEAMKRLLK